MGGYSIEAAAKALIPTDSKLRAPPQYVEPAAESCYRYDPYNTDYSRVAVHSADWPCYTEAEPVVPAGTLHLSLTGLVSFVPYPTEEFHVPPPAEPKDAMARVFIGQLPYQVTDMQLDWLCYTFGRGNVVHYPERITKHDPVRGGKIATGCIHAYCDNETAAEMLNSMHKRLLVDDTGVWYAETPEQQAVLTEYCQMMKQDRTRRFQNRPYDTVVAQYATSTYDPARHR